MYYLDMPGISWADVFNHLQEKGCITSTEAEKEYGADDLDYCMRFWQKELEDFPEAMRTRRIYRCDDGGNEWLRVCLD